MEAKTFTVKTAAVRGAEAAPMVAEVSAAPGLPDISIVGMADASVLEARSRIRCALRASGYELPRAAVVISLSPADMRKAGSCFDLPIAVGVLAATGQIPTGWLDGCLFAGELALDGTVLPARGSVAFQQLAASQGLALATGKGADALAGCGECLSLSTLADLRAGKSGAAPIPSASPEPTRPLDFSDIHGCETAKRAVAVAVAGGHGIALVGGTATSRAMIAERIPSIMPAMTDGEMREVARIHSICGEPVSSIAAGSRPFRSPAPCISAAGFVGGGRPVRPGEVSLAHGGVLYLDDAAEWDPLKLQMMRMPMEEGAVRIVRADGACSMPARFQLVVGADFCPCGGYGQRDAECRCPETRALRYRDAAAGRMLCAGVQMKVFIEGKKNEAGGMDSAELRRMVERARSVAAARGDYPGSMTKKAADFINRSARKMGIDPMRVRDIARTIADMDESGRIRMRHAREAAAYALGKTL